uniref:Uncharacterized protein n=1 Tax=Rhizophora mucronata TaxID=61149 RepID=A0A2P2JAL6_RHIMU
MEKALTKVASLKVGSSWISRKAKEELSYITEDITVSIFFCFQHILVSFQLVIAFIHC